MRGKGRSTKEKLGTGIGSPKKSGVYKKFPKPEQEMPKNKANGPKKKQINEK